MELDDALANPGSEEDVILRNGDRLVVAEYDAMVQVRGEVMFEARVLYRDGMSLEDALNQAGGLTNRADQRPVRKCGAGRARGAVHVFRPQPGRAAGERGLRAREAPGERGCRLGQRRVADSVDASTAATVMIAITRF